MKFHYIVRGIIRDGDHVLLCKQKDGNYTFLLGGHIDFGEAAKGALAREIKEEIGAEITVGQFRGAIENAWDDHCEISLVFDVEHNLLPTPLIDWLTNESHNSWSSTIE